MTDNTDTNRSGDPDHFFLIDGTHFTFRAFHAIPMLTRSDGTPINAVLGFVNMLMGLLEDTDANHIAVIFDSGHRTFRNDIFAEYKANRPPLPEELRPQMPLIREATRAFNVAFVELAGYEADDLIATYTRLAREAGGEVTIVSSDKDLMQLVGDGVVMLDSMKNQRIGPEEVKNKFGVAPNKVVDVQALAGDAIDNVPGIPGIGVNTAAQLINEYGELDTVLQRAGEIKQPKRRANLIEHAAQARISRELVRLRADVPVPASLQSMARKSPQPEALLGFLAAQEFKTVLTRVRNQLAAEGVAIPELEPAPETSATGSIEVAYRLVRTRAELQEWIECARSNGVLSLQTHTAFLDPHRAALVGISLCVAPGQACYVALQHPSSPHSAGSEAGGDGGQRDFMEIEQALQLLRPLLADPAVLKIGYDIKSDMVVLTRYDVPVIPVDDVLLLAYVLEGTSQDHALEALARQYLGQAIASYKDIVGTGKAQVAFDQVALDRAVYYAAERADSILRLAGSLKPRLVTERVTRVYETLERPLIAVLVSMEVSGVNLDRAQLELLTEDFAVRMQRLEAECHTLAGHPFNPGSPKQLGELLFGEMGLQGGNKGKTGAYSTGADVLEGLAATGYELPARVLDWRQISKLKSTYTDALVEQINPNTGRVHTCFLMASASTGRLASAEPNLMNIPIRTEEGRKIRRAFVTEPGRRLLSLDYSQIELRLLAHIADIAALKEAFHEGQDIHALTASQMFGIPVEQIGPAERRRAKAINFGIIYGISAFGLARQLGIPQREAAHTIQAYFERYPGIRDYMERTKEFCRAHGFVTTLFGRRCRIAGIHEKNQAHRSFAERAAINAPIQGSAADVLKRAMIRVPPALERHGLARAARLLLTVHDELLFEVDNEAAEQTADVVRRVMENAASPAVELTVSLTVESGVAESWDQAH